MRVLFEISSIVYSSNTGISLLQISVSGNSLTVSEFRVNLYKNTDGGLSGSRSGQSPICADGERGESVCFSQDRTKVLPGVSVHMR